MQAAADEASARLRENELLILAASTGFSADVEKLVADGADVHCMDKEGTPLLHFPSAKGHIDIVKFLVSKGAELEEDAAGQTALHWAARGNAYEVVKYLLTVGAWVDAYDSNDDTALHIAIRGGHIKTVESLLEGGAKMELTNSRNLTALGEAITVKNAHIVEMLIDKGADVRRISKGFSFLHLAAGLGSLPVLKILLQHLSPETVVHPRGVTPLHCATMQSVPASVVRLLIDHGSDPHTSDDHNKLPLDWAKEGGNENEEVLKLLSVGERKKKRSHRRSRSTVVTEIEPADSPEGEWIDFQCMTYEDKLRQVEVWARSKDEYLNDLVFLDDDSRKAVALVGNFMRMLECRMAIERLQSDEKFQEDASDPQVQKAVAECTEHPQNIRKFASNEKIMGVLVKLKRLSEILRRNGQMKVVYEELLHSQESADLGADEEKMTTAELESALKTAKETVVKAVMGGASSASRKQDEGGAWWGIDGRGDMTDDHHLKLGPTTFLKFLRQLFLALLVFGLMVVGMYLTDSLPSQHPHYASPGNDASISPAFMTNDHGIHVRLNEGNFNPEL